MRVVFICTENTKIKERIKGLIKITYDEVLDLRRIDNNEGLDYDSSEIWDTEANNYRTQKQNPVLNGHRYDLELKMVDNK